MEDIHKIVAANIRKYRKARYLTQAQLAERIGKTVEMVCQVENSMAGTKIATLKLIADCFGIEVYQLLMPEGYPECPRVSPVVLNAISLLETKPAEFIETLNKFLRIDK